MVRGKFQLTNITHNHWNAESKTLRFMTIYDASIEEDKKFAKATPTGTIEMQVDNPAALAKFEIGKYYYVDFTPIQ